MNAIFITVRTGSKRLPNKALLTICGIPTIVYVILRMKHSLLAGKIILCTTENSEDDKLCELAIKHDIQYFRGSKTDKLIRWNSACKAFNINFFVTADGDDLLCDPHLADLAFSQHEHLGNDFIYSPSIVCGGFTYGISRKALQHVCDIKDTDDTEMIEPYFTKIPNIDISQLKSVPDGYKDNTIRLTLDYKEDLDFFKHLITGLGHSFVLQKECTLKEILEYINANKHLKNTNMFRHAEWRQNQLKTTNFKIKHEI